MLNQLSISELVAKLAGREVSARAATQACLDQIQRVDPQIRAFISYDAADALAQADAADQALAQGQTHAQKPLLGVPIGVKDVIAVKGQPLNCGSRILGDFVSPYDATVIEKLKAAGAVVLFPHMPPHLTIPLLVLYGFFFMASYPMTEAALMESVPDAVRGRVFGLFVMGGGVIGNLSHWMVGAKVKQLGAAAYSVNSYFPIYAVIALLMVVSLAGLLCLPAIQRREGPAAPRVEGEDTMPLLT